MESPPQTGIIEAEFTHKGLAVTPGPVVMAEGPSASAPRSSQALVATRPGHSAYLCLDVLPVVLAELAATLPVQLLQDAAVDGQAVVDLREKRVYVRVVGAQQALADLRELRTGCQLARRARSLGGREAPPGVPTAFSPTPLRSAFQEHFYFITARPGDLYRGSTREVTWWPASVIV